MFSRLDADKDGQITEAEAGDKKAQFERLMRTADKNKDGKLSREEFTAGLRDPELKEAPAGGGPGGGRPMGDPKELFRRADRNGDGKIDKDEAPDRMKENFGRIDANGDGSIDEKEFGRVMEMLSGRRPDAPPQTPAGSPPGSSDRPGGPPLVRALDTNGDGEISAEEIASAAESLKKLDKNGDGKLTREELGPPPGEGRPGAGLLGGLGGGLDPQAIMQRLKDADKDGDGKISRDEAPDGLRPLFDRADANGDGKLEPEEVRGALQKLRERMQGNRPKE